MKVLKTYRSNARRKIKFKINDKYFCIIWLTSLYVYVENIKMILIWDIYIYIEREIYKTSYNIEMWIVNISMYYFMLKSSNYCNNSNIYLTSSTKSNSEKLLQINYCILQNWTTNDDDSDKEEWCI